MQHNHIAMEHHEPPMQQHRRRDGAPPATDAAPSASRCGTTSYRRSTMASRCSTVGSRCSSITLAMQRRETAARPHARGLDAGPSRGPIESAARDAPCIWSTRGGVPPRSPTLTAIQFSRSELHCHPKTRGLVRTCTRAARRPVHTSSQDNHRRRGRRRCNGCEWHRLPDTCRRVRQ